MRKYFIRFIAASLLYLVIAVIFGILKVTDATSDINDFAFAHFNLLGFVAMPAYALAYYILPRINRTRLRFQSWISWHFWLANLSLVGLVAARALSVVTGNELYYSIFVGCAALQVISILMFLINLWLTLGPSRRTKLSRSA